MVKSFALFLLFALPTFSAAQVQFADARASRRVNGGKYEVTKAQWQAVMNTVPWSGQMYVLDDPNSPAVSMPWNDIAGTGGFIDTLNNYLTSSGQGQYQVRLPSESEWEYACRAGTTTRFHWGDDPGYAKIGDYAWYDGNAWDAGEKYAHVVGQKAPNSWGLYDMSGNVYEWCEDCFSSYTGTPADGSAWVLPLASSRVVRGGSWLYVAGWCRSAFRDSGTPDTRGTVLGFRLAAVQQGP